MRLRNCRRWLNLRKIAVKCDKIDVMKIFIKQNPHDQTWFWQCVVDNNVVAVQPNNSSTAEDCKAEFRLFAFRVSAYSLDTPEGDLPDFEFQVREKAIGK
jgi:hypothetical protein